MTRIFKPLTAAVLLSAFSLSSHAVTMTEWSGADVMGDPDVQIGSDTQRPFIGVNNTTAGKQVSIDTPSGGSIEIYGHADAVQVAFEGAALNIGSKETQSVLLSVSNTNNRNQVIGVNALYGVDFSIQGKNIEISVDGGDAVARGLSLGHQDEGKESTDESPSYSRTTSTIGSADTENLIVTANGGKGSMGVYSLRGHTQLQAKNIEISSNADGAYGVLVQNNYQDKKAEEDHASLSIVGDNIIINTPNGSGLMAFSNGFLEVKGNLEVNARDAINTRGYSTIEINKDGNSTVVLNGDIAFETPGPDDDSGTIIDAYVDVNLTGDGSSWTGNVYKQYPNENEGNEELTKAENLHVTLADGAQWNPTIITGEQTSTDTKVAHSLNHLTLNDGVINVTKGAEQTVTIETMDGSGGTINMDTAINSEDGSLTTGKLIVEQVDSAAGAPALQVNYTNINADQVTEEAFTQLADSVSATGVTQTRTIEQGAVKGALVETIGADGQSQGVKQYDNTRLTAYGSVAALGVLQWRHDMNDLTKRMGELRTSPEGVGAWARLYGSEQEYGGQGITSKNTSIQVGADFDVGAGWKVGAAFTYTDGNATYDLGDADNKAYGVALYGTWFADNGQFVDLIAKYSRLDTDFNLEGMDGSFDNNAYSVSAEYGWHLKLGEIAFVEPQVELTYGMVSGDDFTTGNDVRIEQDDFDSLIGRVGFRTGFLFPENKGTIYARASVLHDFQGELDSKASLVSDSSVADDINDDLGGTWYEFGIGANFNLTDRTYTYVDLEKNTGGEVKENWRWNVGLRHVF